MYKKLILLLNFIVFVTSFSQDYDIERQAMMKREISTYKNIADFNVNPNTLNYDLRYQRLELNLDPAQYFVSGKITSHFIPNASITSIYFDKATELNVTEVKYHGNNLSFEQLSTNELKVNFASALSANVLDSISVTYSGAPPAANDAFTISTQNSTPVLYTLSEPYGAKDWWITKQSLNDKIEKVDIKITTPSQYNVASNGKLISEIINGTEKTTFWKTNYPIPAYLVALGITNYTKINDVIGNPPFPYVNYIYPSTVSNATSMANIEWTKTCMNNFEQYFGPYPYRNEKYGHMQFNWGGGMEHATMSSMGGWSKGLIAHELAHQWFGDKVTCGTWNDIWLNEGFATFGEHLTNEKLLMTSAQFLTYLSGQINNITAQPGGSVYVADSNLSNIWSIFDSRLSYAKGAYLLRMIKWILGDAAFYQALKEYHARPYTAYEYAVTSEFKNSLFQSTGKDFTEFFNDWLYGQGYPTYTIKWKQHSSTSLRFMVSQTQSHSSVSFFEMPLPIKVNGTGGQVAYLVLDNTTNNQYFDKAISFPVSSVEFNYEYQILTKNWTITNDANLATEDISKVKLNIYPNPAKNDIKISGLSKSENFEIYSIDGKLIEKGKYNPNESISIRNFTKGVYLLKVGTESFKFIKE